MSNEKMQSAYLKEVKERALELAEIVKNKSNGNAVLLPVTKGFGAEEVQAMLEVGLTQVGESYAQEVIQKAQIINDNRIAWHMIGRVQSNKVRKLSETISLWHSVDRKDLIAEIYKRKKESKILIQVDMSNRPQQGGCALGEVPELIEFASGKGLKVDGLMTIGVDKDVEATKRAFSRLAKLAESMGLREISMGMSDDYEIAIDHGATILRVGRGIFGERAKK